VCVGGFLVNFEAVCVGGGAPRFKLEDVELVHVRLLYADPTCFFMGMGSVI